MIKYVFLLFFFTYTGKCLKHSLKVHLEQDLKYIQSDSTRSLKQKSRYDLNEDLKKGLEQGFQQYLKYLKNDLTPQSKHISMLDLRQSLKQGSKNNLEQGLKDDSEHNLNQGMNRGFKQDLKHSNSNSKHCSKYDLKECLKKGSKQGFEQYLQRLKSGLTPRSKHSSKDDLRQSLEQGSKHNLTQGSKQGFKDDSEHNLSQGLKQDLKHLKSDSNHCSKHDSGECLKNGSKHGLKKGSKHSLKQGSKRDLKNDLEQGLKEGLKRGMKFRSKSGLKRKLTPDLNEVGSSKRLLKLPLLKSNELPPPPFGLEGGSLDLGSSIRPRERFLSFLNPFSSITSAIDGIKDTHKFSMRVGVLPKHLSDYPHHVETIDPLVGGVFEELRPSFVAGIPEIGCPVLDPLEIDVLEADIKDFVLKAHIIFENMHVHGLSIVEITALEVDYDSYGFYFAFTLPEVVVKLDYIFDASIVRFVPFRLDGNVTWVSTDIKGKGVGALNISGPDLALSLDGFEMSLDIRHNKLRFSKLLGLSFLDSGLSWVISKFVNAWLILFKNSFSNVVSAYILVVANDVLANIRLWGRQ